MGSSIDTVTAVTEMMFTAVSPAARHLHNIGQHLGMICGRSAGGHTNKFVVSQCFLYGMCDSCSHYGGWPRVDILQQDISTFMKCCYSRAVVRGYKT
jgi:hypothetical protein